MQSEHSESRVQGGLFHLILLAWKICECGVPDHAARHRVGNQSPARRAWFGRSDDRSRAYLPPNAKPIPTRNCTPLKSVSMDWPVVTLSGAPLAEPNWGLVSSPSNSPRF